MIFIVFVAMSDSHRTRKNSPHASNRLKNDGWETTVLLGISSFQGRTVSFGQGMVDFVETLIEFLGLTL